MKNLLGKYRLLIVVASIIIVSDQITKYLVRTQIPLSSSWSPWPWLEPYARIVHWSNTGAAFGILQGFGDVFMVLAIIVAGAILYYYPQVPTEEWPLRLAMGMQFGGAIGNLIDRIYEGHVTDFISVGNFAVFNIADASISVGVAVLILGVLYNEWREKKKASANPPEAPVDGSPSENAGIIVPLEPDAQPALPEEKPGE